MKFTRGDLVAVKIVNNYATHPKKKVLGASGNKEAIALFSQFMAEAMENTFLQNYTIILFFKDGQTGRFNLIDGEMVACQPPPA